MANDALHYHGLAAKAQAEADAATLDNVRDRALRSVAAFEAMARQHERTTRLRAEREALAHDREAQANDNAVSPADWPRNKQTNKEQT